MTIQECYKMLGGNYDQVEKLLPSARLIHKFVVKFLDDGSYRQLCDAMEAGSRAEAFRGAHTLKGVCANLAFSQLCASSSRLTELLRPEAETIPVEAYLCMKEVTRDYEQTVSAIRTYLESV